MNETVPRVGPPSTVHSRPAPMEREITGAFGDKVSYSFGDPREWRGADRSAVSPSRIFSAIAVSSTLKRAFAQ